jgi:YesN/AraC family two-component response regulator
MNIDELLNITKEISLLYVEDDSELRSMHRELFCQFFKRVDSVSNGYEALKLYQEEDYGLIITDINMPIMNGIEMIKKIQNIDPAQKIIVLSAYRELEYMDKMKSLNIKHFLTKPIDRERLFRDIYECLSEKEAA